MIRTVQSHKVLVGLEIHVQLATASKMFTGAANGFGGEPNTQVDAQVLGLPGVLPVMNKKAVEYAIKVGLALGCTIAKHTKWDRKSYYYPDLPKNYQISQYDLPLCYEGNFELVAKTAASKTLRIRRAHLEEDAGKLLHEAPGGYAIDFSIVDLNRAGTPLLEIVTEPDLASRRMSPCSARNCRSSSSSSASARARCKWATCASSPTSTCTSPIRTAKSTRPPSPKSRTSTASACLSGRRHTKFSGRPDTGWKPATWATRATYGWDEPTQSTFLQRDKEEANDYRYFPDPDLPVPVEVDEAWLAEFKAQIGELPRRGASATSTRLGFSATDAATLAADRQTGDFYEPAIAAGGDAKPRRESHPLPRPAALPTNAIHRWRIGIVPDDWPSSPTVVASENSPPANPPARSSINSSNATPPPSNSRPNWA